MGIVFYLSCWRMFLQGRRLPKAANRRQTDGKFRRRYFNVTSIADGRCRLHLILLNPRLILRELAAFPGHGGDFSLTDVLRQIRIRLF
ncbi:hypothetical protein C8R31_104169 [Nitrosospira sp. Nsp2]|nr:hypothetical protein C8R31_104169 [Nitrosospira sp. Nsp2]